MSDQAQRIIRFVRAKVEFSVDSSIAVVEVDTPDIGSYVGTAQGGTGETDQIRAVARATADALSDAFDAQNAKVRVLSVQMVEAIPHSAIVVTLAASKGNYNKNLLGICDIDTHNMAEATALAVLNATNRFLSR